MSENAVEFDQDSPHEPLPKEVRQTVPVARPTEADRNAPTDPPQGEPSIPTTVAYGDDEEVDHELGQGIIDAAPQTTSQEQAKADEEAEQVDVIDVLEPKAAPKEWRLGPEEMPLVFVQRPLGFLAKMKWFALVGEVLDKAMSGDSAISVNDLLSAPEAGRGATRTMADFRDADTFIRALGKLVTEAPDFLVKSYCIWLGVPTHQWKLVEQIMDAPVEEGGLSDEDGLEIVEIFIDQNYDALADFFGGKVATLQRRVQQRQEERSSKKGGRVRA